MSPSKQNALTAYYQLLSRAWAPRCLPRAGPGSTEVMGTGKPGNSLRSLKEASKRGAEASPHQYLGRIN